MRSHNVRQLELYPFIDDEQELFVATDLCELWPVVFKRAIIDTPGLSAGRVWCAVQVERYNAVRAIPISWKCVEQCVKAR